MLTDANAHVANHYSVSSATAIQSNAYDLDKAIQRAQRQLLSLQNPQGFWVFELEADCTIPAEYILMMHYLGKIDEPLQAKIAV